MSERANERCALNVTRTSELAGADLTLEMIPIACALRAT
jgi:hypothetical protein